MVESNLGHVWTLSNSLCVLQHSRKKVAKCLKGQSFLPRPLEIETLVRASYSRPLTILQHDLERGQHRPLPYPPTFSWPRSNNLSWKRRKCPSLPGHASGDLCTILYISRKAKVVCTVHCEALHCSPDSRVQNIQISSWYDLIENQEKQGIKNTQWVVNNSGKKVQAGISASFLINVFSWSINFAQDQTSEKKYTV